MRLKEFLDNKYDIVAQSTLQVVDCCRMGITSLDGIENLTSLKKIKCWGNNITSLKGVEKAHKLITMSCDIDLINMYDIIYTLPTYNFKLNVYEFVVLDSREIDIIRKQLIVESRKEKIKSILE